MAVTTVRNCIAVLKYESSAHLLEHHGEGFMLCNKAKIPWKNDENPFAWITGEI